VADEVLCFVQSCKIDGNFSPHNAVPIQILNANLELVSRSAQPAAEREALEENRRLVRQLDLAASLRTWLALQGHVNSLLDSTTAGPGAKGDVQVWPDPACFGPP
jgi:hypothetical protein